MEIPYFLRIIHNHNKKHALDLFKYVQEFIVNEEVIAFCFSQIATSSYELKEYDQAIIYYEKAIAIFKKIAKLNALGYTNFMLSQIAVAKRDMSSAPKFAKKALIYAEQAEEERLRLDIIIISGYKESPSELIL